MPVNLNCSSWYSTQLCIFFPIMLCMVNCQPCTWTNFHLFSHHSEYCMSLIRGFLYQHRQSNMPVRVLVNLSCTRSTLQSLHQSLPQVLSDRMIPPPQPPPPVQNSCAWHGTQEGQLLLTRVWLSLIMTSFPQTLIQEKQQWKNMSQILFWRPLITGLGFCWRLLVLEYTFREAL